MNDSPNDRRSDSPVKLKVTLLNASVIIGTGLAVLKINGLTFRQAYIRRFGLDPAIFDNADTQLGLDGFDAVSRSALMMAAALVPLIISSAVVLLAAWWISRRRRTAPPELSLSRSSSFIVLATASALVVMIASTAGTIAGTRAAKDRIGNVMRGQVWTYHAAGETIAGVIIAQSPEQTWLLSKIGVRGVKTSDISRIDGPLFDKVVTDLSR